MPQPCSVCNHANRRAIDAAVCAGSASVRAVAAAHGLAESSVRRHRDAHLVRTLALAREAPEAAAGDELLRTIRGLQSKTLQVLLRAEKDGDLRLVLAAVREARGNLELLAKLLGELSDAPTINILVNPEWQRVRSVLLVALLDYPEARVAVAARLASLEEANGAGG